MTPPGSGRVCVIGGNHDHWLEKLRNDEVQALMPHTTYLRDRTVEILGFRVGVLDLGLTPTTSSAASAAHGVMRRAVCQCSLTGSLGALTGTLGALTGTLTGTLHAAATVYLSVVLVAFHSLHL